MARYDSSSRDSNPDDERSSRTSAGRGGGGEHQVQERNDDRRDNQSRDRQENTTTVPTGGLRLPRTPEREPVAHRDRTYQLRGSETELLATVGAFRVVPAADLPTSDLYTRSVDLKHLADQGLIEQRHLVINEQPTTVIVLTKDGKDLLESHREPSSRVREQAYHAGLVKLREIAHDAQLYRLYKAEATRIRAQGGAVRRVVLDYELKRDYQRFLNRRNRPEDTTKEEERRAFARLAELPHVDGHVELPDLRIEYETQDGIVAYRDAELVTEHYSHSQLAGKSAAGFSLYRAVGARGGSNQSGSRATPFDPHHLEWLQ